MNPMDSSPRSRSPAAPSEPPVSQNPTSDFPVSESPGPDSRSAEPCGTEQLGAEYLRRVNRLGPLLDEMADRADRERRLPPALLAGLHEAELFRMLLPKPYGGAELAPAAYARVIEAVAAHDASTAWCLGQANGCAMSAAYVVPEVAEHIWGRDPAAVLAWGPGPAEARPEGDGYRFSGKWSFASGSRHATWLGCHCKIRDADGKLLSRPDGSPLMRTMLIPADRVDLVDIWDVMGLRATGSDAYAIEDGFVTRAYTVDRDQDEERRHHAPLYLFQTGNLYAAAFSSVAIGIVGAMVASFQALAADKTPRSARQRLSDDEVIQDAFARCIARLGAARGFQQQELEAVWQEVLATGEVTIANRMRIRLATTFAIHEAKTVGDTIYQLAGASAIFRSSAFERRFRDLHTVTQQIQARQSHFRTVGAYLFGHEPDLTSV